MLFKNSVKGILLRENKIGANIEPWGTPQVKGTTPEWKSPKLTEKLL